VKNPEFLSLAIFRLIYRLGPILGTAEEARARRGKARQSRAEQSRAEAFEGLEFLKFNFQLIKNKI
jgi:hypothetical protein